MKKNNISLFNQMATLVIIFSLFIWVTEDRGDSFLKVLFLAYIFIVSGWVVYLLAEDKNE